ncbi:hypothetical protein HZH66_009966 [Vespula vulgaris]|uniref:IQ domain-containing protein K n=1 Tax=Vespula vulgaris TaxID=7454 RepID=A0A834JKU3_VESVU|nr:hypothetical protein HZH66_009966 [Vespula vulgaris]
MFSRLAKEYIAGNEICSGCFQDVETNNNVQCQRAESFSPQELRIDDKQEENLWQSIVDEYEEKQSQYTEWKKEQESSAVVVPYQDVSSNYLNRKIFPLLLPAMENMLVEARRWDALRIQKCRFNGIDYLAETLWNLNPKYPKRAIKWHTVFEIPQFKLLLRLHPRPIFPLSWLLTKDEAALYIQRYVRGWLVRKRDYVQEMRQFWKALAEEKANITETLMDEDLGSKEELKMEEQIDDMCEFYKLLGKYKKTI